MRQKRKKWKRKQAEKSRSDKLRMESKTKLIVDGYIKQATLNQRETYIAAAQLGSLSAKILAFSSSSAYVEIAVLHIWHLRSRFKVRFAPYSGPPPVSVRRLFRISLTRLGLINLAPNNIEPPWKIFKSIATTTQSIRE